MSGRRVDPVVVKVITQHVYDTDGNVIYRPGQVFSLDAVLPEYAWRHAIADAAAGQLLGSDQRGSYPHMTDVPEPAA